MKRLSIAYRLAVGSFYRLDIAIPAEILYNEFDSIQKGAYYEHYGT